MKKTIIGILRRLAILGSVLLPRVIQLSIYRFSYWIFKLAIVNEKGNLWYRNSLYFNEIVFGVSDIDLTFVQEEGKSLEQVRKIEAKLKLVGKFLPHLGEINYYSPNTFSDFLPLANPIELKRDPLFLSFLREKNIESLLSPIDISDEQVFVLNWLASDAHRMRENFSFRTMKIKRFLKLLEKEELASSCRDLTALIATLSESFFDERASNVSSFLTDFTFFEFGSSDSINSFFLEFPDHRELFMCLYPQKWLGAALHHKTFNDDLLKLKESPHDLKKIFLKQIRWEAWGLIGQWMRSGDDANFHLHIENLLRTLEVFEEEGVQERKGLKKLSSLHEGKLYSEECHV